MENWEPKDKKDKAWFSDREVGMGIWIVRLDRSQAEDSSLPNYGSTIDPGTLMAKGGRREGPAPK